MQHVAAAAARAAAAGLVVEGRAAGAAAVAARAAGCVALDVAHAGLGVEHAMCADAARVVAVGTRAVSRA